LPHPGVGQPGKARQQGNGGFFVFEHPPEVPADSDVILRCALGDLFRNLAPSLSGMISKHDGAEEIYLR
jgi:hypothetical protein